jgi:hypothetical protein
MGLALIGFEGGKSITRAILRGGGACYGFAPSKPLRTAPFKQQVS